MFVTQTAEIIAFEVGYHSEVVLFGCALKAYSWLGAVLQQTLHPHLKGKVQSTTCSFVAVGLKFGTFYIEAMVNFKPRAQQAAVEEDSWVGVLG